MVDNNVVKETVCNELIIVSAIDIKILSTNKLVSKRKYDSDRQGLQKNIDDIDQKISDTCALIKNTDYNTKKL